MEENTLKDILETPDTIKAIMIDALQKTVKEVSYHNDRQEIYKYLSFYNKDLSPLWKVDRFEIAMPFAPDDMLIDEEGLLRGENYAFRIKTEGSLYMGNALILGVDKYGNFTSPRTTLEDVKEQVMFEGRVKIVEDYNGFSIVKPEEVH